ncbi:ATP-binding protein [Alkalinema pantanalense CENA528]|uniref:ATP-binding protein n=1 Tax=Alkalinema pantanalense TaxID=1620705 RepID=UPI003D6DC04A
MESYSLDQRYSLQVHSDVAVLAQVLSWFNQLYQPSIPKPIWLQCQTILAEGLTNAIRHAHRDKPSATPVDIEVSFSHQQPSHHQSSHHQIVIKVWDCGSAFDLDQKIQNLPDRIDPQQYGGRGIQIMKKLADQIHYDRMDDQRNCLVIIKNY